MASQGPNYAATISQSSTGNLAWSNIGNGRVLDGAYASIAQTQGVSSPPEHIFLRDFGFAIPSNAVISGFVIEMYCYGTNSGGGETFRLPDGSNAVGGPLYAFVGTSYIWDTLIGTFTPPADPSSQLNITGYINVPINTPAWVNMGDPLQYSPSISATYLTPAVVNDPTFTILIEDVAINGLGTSGTMYIDAARVTAYYDTDFNLQKQYLHKVYDDTGNFLGILPNVTSDFGYSQDINSAGAQMTVEVATPLDISQGDKLLLSQSGSLDPIFATTTVPAPTIQRVSSQDASTTVFNGHNSVTVNYPGATTANNMLVAVGYTNHAPGSNSISGWTLLQDEAHTDTGAGHPAGSLSLFYRLSDGTETGATLAVSSSWGLGSDAFVLQIFEYQGLAHPIVVDASGVNTSGGSAVNSLVSASITTVQPNDLIFVCGVGNNISAAPVWTGGTPVRITAVNHDAVNSREDIVSTTQTGYTNTLHYFSGGNTGQMSNIIAAFKGQNSVTTTTTTIPTATLIRNGNRVVIYEHGFYHPAGLPSFIGRMERWEADFGGDGDSETVKVLLYHDGADLDQHIVRNTPFTYTADQTQTTQNATGTLHYDTKDVGGGWDFYGQTFTTGMGVTNLGAISLYLSTPSPCHVSINVFTSPSATTPFMSCRKVYVDTSGSPIEVQFNFPANAIVSALTQYFFTVTVLAGESLTIYYDNANLYANGQMYLNHYASSLGGAWVAQTGKDLYFKTWSTNGNTVAQFSSVDASSGMLTTIMQNYNQEGGLLSFDIDSSGNTISYNFNENTVLESVQQSLALSPSNFYWWVELGTDILHFKQASLTPDVKLIKGRHMDQIKIVATIEYVRNTAYVVGAEVAGSNTYTIDQDGSSVTLYGPMIQRYNDPNIPDATAGHVIGQALVAENKAERYQSVVTVVDGTMDITTLHVGQIVGFEGFGTFVDTLQAQIVHLDRTPDTATLTLGILPKRLNSTLENTLRDLSAKYGVNNPHAPS